MKNNIYGEWKFISDMYFLGYIFNVYFFVIRVRVVVIFDGNFIGLFDFKELLKIMIESEVGLSFLLFF